MLKLEFSLSVLGEQDLAEQQDILEAEPWTAADADDAQAGILRHTVTLPAGLLQEVKAVLPLRIGKDERIFLNGYQTWTYCPEYTNKSVQRGLNRLPKRGVDAFGLDRYGDYHFYQYSEKPGELHGYSYMYVRKGDHFRLIGSVNERPGYTVFQYSDTLGKLIISRDCRRLRADGEYEALSLFFAEGTETEVFDAWFRAMGVKPRTKERIKGYSSWYNRYQNITSAAIAEDLAGCEGVLEAGDLFQIDDGWEPFVGDWLTADSMKFPEGMKAEADKIHAAGFKAGLWLAPFVAEEKSELYTKHPDWFLKVKGAPWKCGSNWSGFYALDIDHPEVVEYIEIVFRRVFDEWDFDLVKLDFLYGVAPFGNARESRAGRMIRAMEWLRKMAGEKLILGCGVPVMPAFGLVDYCRISCDVGLNWNDNLLMQQIHRERVSTKQAIENAIFRRQLDGRAYGSDPDVFFLRTENMKLSPVLKTILAANCPLFGSVLLTSDDMSKYSEEQKARYRQVLAVRDASDVRVYADTLPLKVSFRLNGKEETYTVPRGLIEREHVFRQATEAHKN